MSEWILACDFGGTKLSAALVDRVILASGALTWHRSDRRFSPAGATAGSDIQIMTEMGRDLLAGKRPSAIGISFGGPVNYEQGLVRLSHHVPGWENVPLKEQFEQIFQAPVRVDNDANAAALGEWRFGAGRGVKNMLYVTVSTGVGGGWILQGRPFRGANSLAGEIGHTVVDPQGPLCLCGKRGCVERLASGPYMAQDLAARMGLAEKITGEQIAQWAAEGQKTAVAILERGAWALGVGLGNAINLINPQRVVLGGGVTKSGERWWEIVRETARRMALPEIKFEIVPAKLSDDAPLWGAAALTWK